jgi:hypothetical protein
MPQEIITKTTVYTFDELSPESQARALDDNRYRDIESDYWSECIIEDAISDLDALGFTQAKIQFSGFSCQGDGACFDARIDFEKILEHIDYPIRRKALLLSLWNDGHITMKIERTSFANHYSHERTRYVEGSLDICSLRNCEAYRRIDDLVRDVRDRIEELRLAQAKSVYRKLEEHYFYLTSDEAVRESLTSNELLFTVSGRIFS